MISCAKLPYLLHLCTLYFRHVHVHVPPIPIFSHQIKSTITTLFYPYPLTQKVVCSPVQHLRVQQCVELSHDVDNYLSGSPQIVPVLVQIWQPVILIQPPGILHRNLSWRQTQNRTGSKKQTYRCTVSMTQWNVHVLLHVCTCTSEILSSRLAQRYFNCQPHENILSKNILYCWQWQYISSRTTRIVLAGG